MLPERVSVRDPAISNLHSRDRSTLKAEQRERDGETERLGGLEVEDQLNPDHEFRIAKSGET